MQDLTVIIPYYKNIRQLERCLEYLNKQTLKNISVKILNDFTEDKNDYSYLKNKYENLIIEILKNEKNLGAMDNMFKCIHFSSGTKYNFCIHQDDALCSADYLEKAIEILDHNKNISFVIGTPIWFRREIPVNLFRNESGKYITGNERNFADMATKGIQFIWGTVVYRNITTKDKDFLLDKYYTLCDRPFLMSLLEKDKLFALFEKPIIFEFSHEEEDQRSDKLLPEHIFKLHSFYMNKVSDKNNFEVISTNDILFNYIWLKRKGVNFKKYISDAKKQGLFKLSKIRARGLLSLPFYFLGIKYYYKIKKLIKNGQKK